jgi:metal-responsive CopG/Arc/MetJ family transcriptional regulator
MPRTINGENSRKSMRVPAPMIEEIDKIVMEYPELHYNRQQFVESAIREKIERMQLVRGNNSKNRSS